MSGDSGFSNGLYILLIIGALVFGTVVELGML